MISEKSPSKFTCVGCRIKFETAELQRVHFKTEWHLYNLKRKVCNLEPIDLESFNQIQANSATPSIKPSETTASISSKYAVKEPIISSDSDWTEINDDDEDSWEDVDEEDLLARVIKEDTCLFCNKRSKTIEENVRHMDITHGFFIPEAQYLTDLEGLLEYLGYKVGAGATCLWCNKELTTTHGAQLHMMYKNHCKIYYDHEAAAEFKEFYDYSNQELHDMKPSSQLVVKRRPTHERYRLSVSGSTRSLVSRSSRQLMQAKNNLVKVPECKSLKKFEAYRNKIVLRTGMANNDTMRSRLRKQNPI